MLEQNLSERIKQFKKIDAHSHVGYFGSWCDVGITPEDVYKRQARYPTRARCPTRSGNQCGLGNH